jgi:large subunit ribosomal protein L19
MKKMKAVKYTKETILTLGVTNRNFPSFQAGDTIIVTTKVPEVKAIKAKETVKATRNQTFEGVVLAIKNSGIAMTFTVRRIMDGISIERIYPYYSPNVLSIDLKEEGSVRRAKLYYLRDRYGKKSEVKRKKKNKEIKVVKNSGVSAAANSSMAASAAL